MADNAAAPAMTDDAKIQKLAARLRQFADQFNWTDDTEWTPDVVELQLDPPSELAAKTLKECGL